MSRIEKALRKSGESEKPVSIGSESQITILPCPNDWEPEPILVSHRAPQSHFAEQFRHSANALARMRRRKTIGSIAFVSPGREEGKTTVLLNTAVVEAQRCPRGVLVIDGDLRSPSCHRVLGIKKPETTLCGFLSGSDDSPPVVHATPVPNLFLLPAGKMERPNDS